MQPLSEWQQTLLLRQPSAHLATLDETGQPHVVPVVFAFDGQRIFTPLDGKPKHVPLNQLRRVRNIQQHSQVALVVDHYDDDWQRLAWVQVRGRANIVTSGLLYDSALQLLRQKYPQYQTTPLDTHLLIAITIEQLRSWRAQPDHAA